MFEQVQKVVDRYEELTRLFASPEVSSNPDKIREYAQEQSDLQELVTTYREYLSLERQISEAREMLDGEADPDMRVMIEQELGELEPAYEQVTESLSLLLAPKDPRDAKNVLVEIRAGAGGDEAGLFAGDLSRMYMQYAGGRNWHTQILSSNETGIGGYKEIIFEVKGREAFSRLKFESGVHRVQRVPVTETSGRIHTSTATVAVLPEVDDVEVDVKDSDLRIDCYRAGGHGGQGVNTTDSAVRITHLPTGIVAQCQDERSQLQNRARAMSILRARIYDLEFQRQFDVMDEERRQQVGSGERSEKIRTYNFPQNRVTDHRIGKSLYRIDAILAGDLDEFIDELIEHDQKIRLQSANPVK